MSSPLEFPANNLTVQISASVMVSRYSVDWISGCGSCVHTCLPRQTRTHREQLPLSSGTTFHCLIIRSLSHHLPHCLTLNRHFIPCLLNNYLGSRGETLFFAFSGFNFWGPCASAYLGLGHIIFDPSGGHSELESTKGFTSSWGLDPCAESGKSC